MNDKQQKSKKKKKKIKKLWGSDKPSKYTKKVRDCLIFFFSQILKDPKNYLLFSF